MNVAIIGSREFNDYGFLKKKILENHDINQFELIVSGGAAGSDSLSQTLAKEFGIPILIMYPKWNTANSTDRSAGFKRNIKIIEKSDIVIAFHRNNSKGTAHSIELAKKMGKEVFIY